MSDPHERAWYDSHRDAILRGEDATGDAAETASFRNIRITSTEEILSLIRKFNSNVPLNDDPIGFFTVARETFEHLALEEEAAAELEDVDAFDFPTFGQSEDEYEGTVKPFYAAWAGFSTKKNFAWKDKYRLSDAPDRRVRRLMEKENKKLREDGIREFNDAVRFLVTFVRKRDPRYVPNTQTQAERQEAARGAAAAQAARSRAANQEKVSGYQLPAWAASRELHPDEGEFSLSEAESEVEVLECVVCDKTFKSDKQLEAHERSKKHMKAVQQLRWEMRKEGVDLELDDNLSGPEQIDLTPAEIPEGDSDVASAAQTLEHSSSAIDVRDTNTSSITSSAETDDDGDYAPRADIAGRITAQHDDNSDVSDLTASASVISLAAGSGKKKIGKAKAKRERKAAAAEANGGESKVCNPRQLCTPHADVFEQHPCTVCAARFDSRTKLFEHIRMEGHAAAPRGAPNSQPKKKKK